MLAQDSQPASFSSGDEERRHLLDLDSQSPSSGSPASDEARIAETVARQAAETKLTNAELECINKATAKNARAHFYLPSLRTAAHISATALNSFTDEFPTDLRIIALAFATMLTYGILPLSQLRTTDASLEAARLELHQSLGILQRYPQANRGVIEALRDDIEKLKPGSRKLDHFLSFGVALLVISSALGALFSALRRSATFGSEPWLPDAIKYINFAIAAMMFVTFALTTGSQFYGIKYGQMAQVARLHDRINGHMAIAQGGTSQFINGALGQQDIDITKVIAYLVAKAKHERAQANLSEIETALVDKAQILQESEPSFRQGMIELLGNVNNSRGELRHDLNEIKDCINQLNDKGWGLLGYQNTLSNQLEIVRDIHNIPEALLRLIESAISINLSELSQFKRPVERDPFTRNCLRMLLCMERPTQQECSDVMSAALSQASPNLVILNEQLADIITNLTSVSLEIGQDGDRSLLATALTALQALKRQLTFRDDVVHTKQFSRFLHSVTHYEQYRELLNKQFQGVEKTFASNISTSAFFNPPRFERVMSVDELLLTVCTDIHIPDQQAFSL
jgi:hypothetical protein